MTDQPIEPSILDAIEQGRGDRGKTNPRAWSRQRAQVLTAVHRGLTSSRIGGDLGTSQRTVILLFAEGCEAVLRGGAVSDPAEGVCADKWRRWCTAGDTEACNRLRRC